MNPPDPKTKENAMKKPYAVAKDLVCSECALPWADHREPSFRECIRLLKAQPRTTIINTPPIYPSYPVYPQLVPYRPYWVTISGSGTAGQTISQSQVANTSKLTLNPGASGG